MSKKPCGLPTAGKRNLRKKAEVGGQSFLFLSNYSKADTALHHKVSSDEVENFCTGISSFSCHGEDLCEAVKLVYIYIYLVLPVYCYQPISLHPRAHMLSHVIPWTSAHQTPLSVDFSRQEYWSGLPFPSPKTWFCDCRIILISIVLVKKFIQVFLLYFMERPEPTFWPTQY